MMTELQKAQRRETEQKILNALPKGQAAGLGGPSSDHSALAKAAIRGPTIPELVAALGLSDKTVRATLKSLVGRGLVSMQRVIETTNGASGKASSFKRYIRR